MAVDLPMRRNRGAQPINHRAKRMLAQPHEGAHQSFTSVLLSLHGTNALTHVDQMLDCLQFQNPLQKFT